MRQELKNRINVRENIRNSACIIIKNGTSNKRNVKVTLTTSFNQIKLATRHCAKNSQQYIALESSPYDTHELVVAHSLRQMECEFAANILIIIIHNIVQTRFVRVKLLIPLKKNESNPLKMAKSWPIERFDAKINKPAK